MGIPVPVQPPVAPRIDEPVADLHLQHVQPPRPLPARRQARSPEPVQLQPIPHGQRQPACAPLAGIAHLHVRDPDLHHLAVQRRGGPIRGKQRQLPRARRLVQHRNRTAPRRALTVVDLPEVEHLALHNPAAADAHVLHHAPVAVLLAVLAAHLAAHEHASIVRAGDPSIKGVGRHYTGFWQATNSEPPGFAGTPGRAGSQNP